MKKTLSMVLTILLLLCSFSFLTPVCAADLAQADLNLSQYTLDDLASMPAEEYRALLRDFERAYDPFDTYDKNPIMEEEPPAEPGVTPFWASGTIDNDEYIEQGSHEMITAQALNVLANDKGVFSTNVVEVLAICLSISLASLMPDQEEIGFVFAGHFYHAVDGDNYLGSTTNTALTNCLDHYDYAVIAARNRNWAFMCNEIGRALHYLQDAGEPHHASNITVVNIAHKHFETFVNDHIDSYVNTISSLNGYRFSATINPTYGTAVSHSVGFLVQQAASIAYTFRSQVNNTLNRSYWDYVASETIPNAAGFSALLLYKMTVAAGMPLY